MVTTTQSNSTDTLAARTASANFDGNLRALSHTQPELARSLEPAIPHEWVFARDGFLTSLDATGQWQSGCSLPLLAAREVFKEMSANGSTVCFMLPSHAAQLVAVLELLSAEQAVIAVFTDTSTLQTVLGCADFAPAIEAHRLWLIEQHDWQSTLHALLDSRDGLCVPGQFLRLPTVPDDTLVPYLKLAQEAFGRVATARGHRLKQLHRTRNATTRKRLCIACPTHFRQWRDHGHVLRQMLETNTSDKFEAVLVDVDDPLTASPLHLARVVADCDAVLTIDLGRGDLGGVLPDNVPIVTWSTTGRVPSGAAANRHDVLITHDRSIARASGWQDAQTVEAGLPPRAGREPHLSRSLSIIRNTTTLEPPKRLDDYSSHRLLWELIREELLQKPFALGADIDGFLADRAARVGVDVSSLVRTVFIDELIYPAYAQGIARLLIRAGLQVDIYGSGWDRIDRLKSHSRWQVSSRADFDRTIDASSILVDVWPGAKAHPVYSQGLPVLDRTSNNPNDLIERAIAILAGSKVSEPPLPPPLTVAVLEELLARGC